MFIINLLHMRRILFIILLLVPANSLFAQYLHYSDKRNIDNTLPAAEAAQPIPKAVVKDTIIIRQKDTVKQVVRDTIRLIVRDTIRIRDTVIIRDTVRLPPDTIIYHQWPDKCPGLSGATPVLTNYVSKEIVLKLTEIYKGHLYSISSIKAANNKSGYKLKVCENGEIRFEYADEHGEIIKNKNAKIK